MLIRSLALAAALALGAVTAVAHAGMARGDAMLETVQTKVPPPVRPNDGCYYGRKCMQTRRYGEICWRVACPLNTPTLVR